MPTRSEAAITVMLNDFKFSSKILNLWICAVSFGYYILFVSTCID